MSVPSPAFVGTNGSRWAAAWSRQISVCSLYSSISTCPAWTAAPEARGEPEALEARRARRRRAGRSRPRRATRSACPRTTATTVRSFTRRRASVAHERHRRRVHREPADRRSSPRRGRARRPPRASAASTRARPPLDSRIYRPFVRWSSTATRPCSFPFRGHARPTASAARARPWSSCTAARGRASTTGRRSRRGSRSATARSSSTSAGTASRPTRRARSGITRSGLDLTHVLRTLGVGRAVLVGFSYGGNTLLHLLGRDPRWARALVTVGASAEGDPGRVEEIMTGPWPSALRNLRHATSENPDYWQELRTALAHDWAANLALDDEALARITCPALVCHGADDVFQPLPYAERLAAGLPASRARADRRRRPRGPARPPRSRRRPARVVPQRSR